MFKLLAPLIPPKDFCIMKIKLLLMIFALIGNLVYAQEVLLQGNIASVEPGFQPASTTAAFYKFRDSLDKEHIAAIPVNHLGQFRKTLPANIDVQVYIYYNEFIPIDTIINTGDGPVLSIRLMLVSKMMQFSAATAQEDIEGQKVRIIFHDAQMARLFQKAGFQDKYGFIFSYVPRPDSWEELRDISEYNAIMESYLDKLNSTGWRDKLYAEMDSLIDIRESFAGLDTESDADDATVFIDVTEKPVATQPVDSEVADVYAIPKELMINSEPLQKTDSLDLAKAIYLPLEPKEPIKGLAFDEVTDEPSVRLPKSSQSPNITTESNPEIFIPQPIITNTVPVAMEETIPPVIEIEEMMVAKSPGQTNSGPSSSFEQEPNLETEVVAETILEDTSITEAVVAETQTEIETEVELPTPPIVAESNASTPTVNTEDKEASLTSLDEIVRKTNEDPNLIPGIHIEALPMTPPPPREEAPTQAKPDYSGGSIVVYFDGLQSDALTDAVEESERLYGTDSQTNLPKSWCFPRKPILNPVMEGRLRESTIMFENYYVPRLKWQTDAPVAFMLERIDKDPNYGSVEIIKYWSALHYESLIPELIFRITYTEMVGLKNYRDIIIWDRVDSGDMVLTGPGAEIIDDLFSVAGRANYLLKNLTGEDFGDVGMSSSVEERLVIRDHWVNWLLSLENGQSFVAP